MIATIQHKIIFLPISYKNIKIENTQSIMTCMDMNMLLP
jgi:hypothetical protein